MREVIRSVLPKDGSSYGLLKIDNIENPEKLAPILYDIVGERFLYEVYGKKSVDTEEFRQKCIEGAIASGVITLDELVEGATAAAGYKSNESDEASPIKKIAKLRIGVKWGYEICRLLGLPHLTVERPASPKSKDPSVSITPVPEMKPLHDYQIQASQHIMMMIRDEMMIRGEKKKESLITIPTGAGKTRLVVDTMIDWLNERERSPKKIPEKQRDSRIILWIAQTTELCDQAVENFSIWYNIRGKSSLKIYRLYDGLFDLPIDEPDQIPKNSIVVATIAGLYSKIPGLENESDVEGDEKNSQETTRIDRFKKYEQNEFLNRLGQLTGCIIIDEAHRSIANSYTAVLRGMGFDFGFKDPAKRNKNGIVLIGLTATPFRGSGIKTKYDAPTFQDLEKQEPEKNEPDMSQEYNVETRTLRNRFSGNVFIPAIHKLPEQLESEYELKPTAIIDIPDAAFSGEYVRLSSLRSFDNQSIIEKQKWTIKMVDFAHVFGTEPVTLENEIEYHKFDQPGLYSVKLAVTNKNGKTDDVTKTIQVIPNEIQENKFDQDKQKELMSALIDRGILCRVVSATLEGATETVTGERAGALTLKTGEVQEDTLAKIAINGTRNRKILDTIKWLYEHHGKRRILFFACNIAHAREITILLKANYGLKAEFVDSKVSTARRVAIIEKFRKGEINILCNVDILTTGFDVPEIDCVFVGRPVGSTVLYTQMIGRGMRGVRMGGKTEMWLFNIHDYVKVQQPHFAPSKSIKLGWQVFQELFDFAKPGDFPELGLMSHDKIMKLAESDAIQIENDRAEARTRLGQSSSSAVPSKGAAAGVVASRPEIMDDETLQRQLYYYQNSIQNLGSGTREWIAMSRKIGELKAEKRKREETKASALNSSGQKKEFRVIKHSCITCGNVATGFEEIKKIFGISDIPDDVLAQELKKVVIPNDVLALDLQGKTHQLMPLECETCRRSKPELVKKAETVTSGRAAIICPYCKFFAEPDIIRDYVVILLGLYALQCQETGTKPSVDNAKEFISKYDYGDDQIAITKTHPAFAAYMEKKLLTVGEDGQIKFEKILNPAELRKLCMAQITSYDEQQSRMSPQESKSADPEMSEIDKTYEGLKKVFGHTPTTRQFEEAASKQVQEKIKERGGYAKFLKESKNEWLEDDERLKDNLYDEYFEKFSKIKRRPNKQELHEYGSYRMPDYEEVFGTFEHFENMLELIIKKLEAQMNDATQLSQNLVDRMIKDYADVRTSSGGIPVSFEIMRAQSKIGLDVYLYHFESFGKFKKIADMPPGDVFAKHSLTTEYNEIKKILGMQPTARQMYRHAKSAAEILKRYAGNYNSFLQEIGEPLNPIEPAEELRLSRRKDLITNFLNEASKRGTWEIATYLHHENKIPYVEWFDSKEKFALEINKHIPNFKNNYDKVVTLVVLDKTKERKL